MMNKKQIQKKLLFNSQAVSQILAKATKDKPLPASDIEKVQRLCVESDRLKGILHPRPNVPSNFRDPVLHEIEANYNRLHSVKAKVCPSCGAPDQNNRMNRKLWCFNCNRPFDSPSKVPFKKRLPKGVMIIEEEMREFEEKAKLLRCVS